MEQNISNIAEFFRPEYIQTGLALLFFGMAFKLSIKNAVRKRQKYKCAECGDDIHKLEVHHRLPLHKGGSDDIDNAVGLCPNDHQTWDEISRNEPIIYPGIYVTEAKGNIFKRKKWRIEDHYPDYTDLPC